MPVQGTQFSPSASAVNTVQEAFKINTTDGYVKFAVKVAGRTLSNAALSVAAAVETVVLAVITVIASPLYFLHNKSFNSITARTALAGRATAEALRGIVGKSTETPADGQKVATRFEQAKAIVDQVWNGKMGGLSAKDVYNSAASYVSNNPGKVKIAGGMIALGLAAYFLGFFSTRDPKIVELNGVLKEMGQNSTMAKVFNIFKETQGVSCKNYLPFRDEFSDKLDQHMISGIRSEDMQGPYMWGIDKFNRTFIAIRYACSQLSAGAEKGVVALFEYNKGEFPGIVASGNGQIGCSPANHLHQYGLPNNFKGEDYLKHLDGVFKGGNLLTSMTRGNGCFAR